MGGISVNIRPARERDLRACASLDHSVKTTHAWRIEEQEIEGKIRLNLYPVRLPRLAQVAYPRQGDDLVAGWEGVNLFLIAVGYGRVCGYVTARSFPGHGLVWVHYDEDGNPSVVRDQGGFRGGVNPALGSALDY